MIVLGSDVLDLWLSVDLYGMVMIFVMDQTERPGVSSSVNPGNDSQSIDGAKIRSDKKRIS